MNRLKIIFMGTPKFAVPIAEEILKKHDIVLVVTQPDQYNSRKKTVIYSPVKQWAISHNIEVFQPEKIRKENQKIMDMDVDLICTAAYGQLISDSVLNHPKYKSINIHGSLLPEYRGGAPIQRAIINGNTKTGITIMYMAKKMDSGDILKQCELEILDSDNQDTLFDRLSILGSQMINDTIEDLVNNKIIPQKQDDSKVSFAYNLTKEDEIIDFTKTAKEVFNQIRGLNSNPGGYFVIDNQMIKVYNSRVSTTTHNKECGTIVGINKDSFDIACKDGTVISILEIQLPSKNKMSARDFINGQGKKILQINKVIKGE